MTAHTCRKKTAAGSRTGKMVRVAVSLPDADMKRVLWLAERRKVPAAKVLRDAVWAYMLPIRTQADAALAAAILDANEAAKARGKGAAPAAEPLSPEVPNTLITIEAV